MDEFQDANGATVKLSFNKNTFKKDAQHVFILCQYNNKWLLTQHKQRGREFPGGKREPGETLEEAARREVFEETGATITSLKFIGEYEVTDQQTSFVKAIFLAIIDQVQKQADYYETEGPVVVSNEELMANRFSDAYSFVMQDDVVRRSLERIKQIPTSE